MSRVPNIGNQLGGADLSVEATKGADFSARSGVDAFTNLGFVPPIVTNVSQPAISNVFNVGVEESRSPIISLGDGVDIGSGKPTVLPVGGIDDTVPLGTESEFTGQRVVPDPVNPPPPEGGGDDTRKGGFITISAGDFGGGGPGGPGGGGGGGGAGGGFENQDPVIVAAPPENPNIDTGDGSPETENPNVIIVAPVNPNLDTGDGSPPEPPKPPPPPGPKRPPDISIGDPIIVASPKRPPDFGPGDPPEPPPPPPPPVNPFELPGTESITAARSVVQTPFVLPDRTVVATKNPVFQSPIKNELNTPLTENLRGDEIIPRIEGGLIFGEFSSDVSTPTDGPTLPSNSVDGNVLPGVTSGAETSSANTLAREQPVDVNYLYQTFFRLQIPLFKSVNYFCQRVTLPGYGTASAIERPTRFASLKIPETRVSFDNLEVTFLVDKNLENWREIQNWMKSIYLVKDHTKILPDPKDHTSDANLILLNSAMNPNLHILFNNIFPVSLSGLDFDSSITDFTPFTATVTFAYDTYEFVDPETGSSL